MNSRIPLLLLALALLPASNCEGDTAGGQVIDRLTIRLSVTSNLTQALGDSLIGSFSAVRVPGQCVSADGRFVAFESSAQNLTTDDPNTVKDVFVKDRLTGAVERVSKKTQGPLFPGLSPVLDSDQPSISPDGRYVVWISAGDLAGMFNAFRQVLLHDRATGQTRLALNAVVNADCSNPVVTVDAANRVLVAFVSEANVVGGYSNGVGFRKIWCSDVTNPGAVTTVQLSAVGPTGVDAHHSFPRFSQDGSVVTFVSEAATLHPDDPDANPDVYMADPDGGPPGGPTNAAPELVSRRDDDDLKISGDSSYAWPSGDGRYVVFLTNGDIGTLPAISGTQIVRRDRQAGGATALISITQAGALPNSGVSFPSVSADGQTVAFRTDATNLVTLSPALGAQVCVRMPDGRMIHVSVDFDGAPSEFNNWSPVMSGDGRWACWYTSSSNLVPADTNASDDVFAHGPLR